MLAGMLLHQIEPTVKIYLARHDAAHFQGFVAQVDDLLAPLLHIGDLGIAQSAGIAGLPAPFRVKSGLFQNHPKSGITFFAGYHRGRKLHQILVFVI